MAPKIQNKRSSTASNPPTDTQLDPGEIALNTNATTANLHFKDAGNAVRSIGADPTAAGTYVRNVAGANAVGTWVPASDGVVDLDYTPAATEGTVTNTAGTDATLPFATSAEAGLFIEAATPGSGTVQYARQVTDAGAASWAQVAIPPGTIVGPDADRPASPDDGQTFYNTDNSTLWVWDNDNSTWAPAMVPVPTGGGDDYTTATLNERCFFNNEQQIDNDYTVTSTTNSGSFGPITVDAAATVTVDSGGTWTVVGGAGQSIDIAGFWSRDPATTTLSPANAGDTITTTGVINAGNFSGDADDTAGARIHPNGWYGLSRESSEPGSTVIWQAYHGTNRTSQINADGSILVNSTNTSASFACVDCSRTITEGQNIFFRAQTGSGRSASLGVRFSNGAANPSGYINLTRPSTGVGRFYWTGIDNNFRTSNTVDHIGTDSGSVVGTQTSDRRLKKNIRSCDHGLAQVLQLEPRFFEYIENPDVAQAGFIAQEVQSIIPEAVYDTKETLIPPELVDPDDESQGYKPNPSASEPTVLAMDYVKLIPALVNAIKELQAEIETLKGGTN